MQKEEQEAHSREKNSKNKDVYVWELLVNEMNLRAWACTALTETGFRGEQVPKGTFIIC